MSETNETTPQNVFYFGQSMKGTLRDGDFLTIETIAPTSIRVGDIIVYRNTLVLEDQETLHIAHRVMAIVPGGILMRGDNNPTYDVHLVRPADLMGRVTHVERAGKRRPVQNGQIGLLRGKSLHAKRAAQQWAWRMTVLVGGKAYRRLKKSGIVQRFWRPSVIQVALQTPDGPMIKYISRGRTVASWWPQSRRFQVKHPYDLVISAPEDPAPK